jgi:hypothetical protein
MELTKRYKVSGTNREVGAIGIMVPFSVDVEASNEEEARHEARTARYGAGFEHVHCLAVEESD